MRHVGLDRLGREVQLRGDAPVRVARGDQRGDLALAVGERADTALRPRRAAPLAGDATAEPPQLERGLVVQAPRLLVPECRGERDRRLTRAACRGERLAGEQVRAGRVEHVAGLVRMARRGARRLGGAGRLTLREQDRRAGALGLAGAGGEIEPGRRALGRERPSLRGLEARGGRGGEAAAASGAADAASGAADAASGAAGDSAPGRRRRGRTAADRGQFRSGQDLVPLGLERALDERQVRPARGLQQVGAGVLPRLQSRLGQVAAGQAAPVGVGQARRDLDRVRADGQRQLEVSGEGRDPGAEGQRPGQ